jgi:hypothetical protein
MLQRVWFPKKLQVFTIALVVFSSKGLGQSLELLSSCANGRSDLGMKTPFAEL